MSTRGRAGKYNKPSRGGGKKFSRNLAPLDADGNQISMWADPRDTKQDESSEEESSEEESSEEESSEDETPQQDMTREQRRAAAKAKKEAAIRKKNQTAAEPGDLPPSSDEESDDDMPANPNHSAKAARQAQAVPTTGDSKAPSKDSSQLTRREREAIQAQQAKERYQKLHAEGKTDEARADLARLALVRQKREEEAARKKAEKEEREAAEKQRQQETDAREQKKREAALGSGGAKKGKKKA